MTRTSLAALILALTMGSGVAHAQGDASHVSGPDGTVGAMRAVVQGLATSPADVAAQQEGRSTAADGARLLDDRPATSADGSAPGTVGAAPGNDAAR